MSIGIVVGNLGTPKSFNKGDVAAYLREFLMDPYVIDKPYLLRWPLVNLLISPFRSTASAHAYKSVWMAEGSPLLVHSRRLTEKLRTALGADYKVVLGMRYGEPSLDSALRSVQTCEKIFLAPQYPQYAESSYQTWVDAARDSARRLGLSDKIRLLKPFYAEEEYLKALKRRIETSLEGHQYDHLLFSFHGLPERHMTKLDSTGAHCLVKPDCCDHISDVNRLCYRAQCYSVARETAIRLGLSPEQYSVSFQSRLGREPWIQPFTDHVIGEFPQKGIKKLAVVMPAFTVDCLETLEEIHIRAKKDFLAAGGQEFHPVACLNDDVFWAMELAHLIKKNLSS